MPHLQPQKVQPKIHYCPHCNLQVAAYEPFKQTWGEVWYHCGCFEIARENLLEEIRKLHRIRHKGREADYEP